MNQRIIFSLLFLIASTSIWAGHHKDTRANNIAIVDTFWENILTNPSVSMDLLHDEFEFEFMGICEICQKYNKETYESVWLGKVIPEVLPNGIDINIYQRIADGDMVLMEPINDSFSLRNGDIVSAWVPGLGTTLKYFFKRGGKIFLEAANSNYDPIELNLNEVVFQGKLLAVWRKV